MTEARKAPRLYSIPPGVPFLPALTEALLSGRLVPGFRFEGDPLSLSNVTIYLPTRRAVRELRAEFMRQLGGDTVILPSIRALGEFEEELTDVTDEGGAEQLVAINPPISHLDRILMLAPLVQAWKSRLPAHVAALFEEGVVIPASIADGLWLARDLADLMDEVETEEGDWTRLADLAPEDLAVWWQVTLEFLQIVTEAWPQALAEMGKSNPAAHRNAMISAEVERLKRNPPKGPVIAAGSTGSNPAVARLLGAIARLEQGAVVLPGLDLQLDDASWAAIGDSAELSSCGHPQFGLKRLLTTIGAERVEVQELGAPSPTLAARRRVVSEAQRPAQTTDYWAYDRAIVDKALALGALQTVSLIEAATEREEAEAIAVALRHAISASGNATAALITPNREMARRVAMELRRFGIRADDSGARPLADSVPATLLRLMIETVCHPEEPVAIVSLLKHPLLHLSLPRETVRRAAELIELVALRGGTGRPDIAHLGSLFENRLVEIAASHYEPNWFKRMRPEAIEEARDVLARMAEALAPLASLRERMGRVRLAEMARATVLAFESLARQEDQSLTELYRGEAGDTLTRFLRELVETQSGIEVSIDEWPDVFAALIAGRMVKPPMGGDHRVFIWSPLEARLQYVDTLVLGSLNEGSWPQVPSFDRFMSRLMKSELSLLPPERRIGLAAHDFMMAMGAPNVVLSRSARSGNAPAVASRWLQRLAACIGPDEAEAMWKRGRKYLDWAAALAATESVDFAPRPNPKPPLEARPKKFSVTEIETLRRDPYAIYARKILQLQALEPYLRDPGAAERGNLFHEALHEFVRSGIDPMDPEAGRKLIEAGEMVFREAELPQDVHMVWWPRYVQTAQGILEWERARAGRVLSRYAEISAYPREIGSTGVTLSGRADRIDLLEDGSAEIIDYKTGSSPSVKQAYTLLSPQLALEAALLKQGAFGEIGQRSPGNLTYVRLRANGEVEAESILKPGKGDKTAEDLAQEAWERLERLIKHYGRPGTGYLSRALPFKEGDVSGDYDHLARVLEWSAGGDGAEGDAE